MFSFRKYLCKFNIFCFAVSDHFGRDKERTALKHSLGNKKGECAIVKITFYLYSC